MDPKLWKYRVNEMLTVGAIHIIWMGEHEPPRYAYVRRGEDEHDPEGDQHPELSTSLSCFPPPNEDPYAGNEEYDVHSCRQEAEGSGGVCEDKERRCGI